MMGPGIGRRKWRGDTNRSGRVVSTENRGAAAARNHAFQLRQETTSSGWMRMIFWPRTRWRSKLRRCEKVTAGKYFFRRHGCFYYRTLHAHFVQNSLCQDLLLSSGS